jgi:cellulose synthase/poly-beta-1,6-N-acetylglucosamine synthase-like glycosyltransferase
LLTALARLLSAFVLLWPVAGYPLVLRALARRGTAPPPSTDDFPTLTVIVPTHKEAAVIERRLHNIEACSYAPDRLEVIVVDSASGDGTADRAEACASASKLRISVVREHERAGKAAAINEGLGRAAGDVIVVTDAPAMFDPDALLHIAAAFADKGVGAASGRFIVSEDGGDVQRMEAQFWRIRNELRTLEAGVDSTPFLSGEMCAFRQALVPAVDADTLADDMNVALQVRRAGYRAVIAEDARVSERRSDDLAELAETKARRAAGGVQELVRARDMLFSARYGLFGMVILPSAFVYYLPLRLPAAAVLASAALRAAPGRGTRAALFAVGGAAAFARRRDVAMLLFNEWCFLQGWRRYLGGRMDVRWRQERSTRAAGGGGDA